MKVCMLAYTHYERDNRVRRYAETLVRRGDAVDVISLRWGDQRDYDRINGVRVFRVQSREVSEKRKVSYFCKVMNMSNNGAINMIIAEFITAAIYGIEGGWPN